MSLQTSYLICLPVSLFTLSLFLHSLCLGLITQSHPLKTVFCELNREHLIEGLSLSVVMQRLLVPTRITLCLVVAMDMLLPVV
jgi:hypothetical protein